MRFQFARGLFVIAALMVARCAAGAEPDPGLNPTFGTAALKAGFAPDPFRRDVSAGGKLVSKLGGVNAHVAQAPEFRLEYTAGAAPLTFEVESTGETTLLIRTPDGKWVANGDGLRGQVVIEKPASGRYDIYVGAVAANTIPATLIVTGQPRTALVGKGNLPDCHLLSVGVDFFVRENMLRGCRNDARVLSEALRKQAGTVYRKVGYEALLGEPATQKEILNKFYNFADVGFPGDTFVLSLAGHGSTDGPYWFFTPSNYVGRERDTQLLDEQLLVGCEKLMSQGKTVVLILDCCKSGVLIQNAGAYFARRKEALETGGLVVMAACAATQSAINFGDNGVLSKTISEALTAAGDLDGDGRITFGEIQKYVTRRAAELLAQIKHEQDFQIAYFGTLSKDKTVAVAKTSAPAAGKFQRPKLAKSFGDATWDVAGLERKFTIVSCRVDPARPQDLVFALDLREDMPRQPKAQLVLVDSDGVKTTYEGSCDPRTGNAGGRMVLTFTGVLETGRREKWNTAVNVQFTLE